jgi:hypothetical protein
MLSHHIHSLCERENWSRYLELERELMHIRIPKAASFRLSALNLFQGEICQLN